MKRHLSFVAALGLCFFASITAAYAQVRADPGGIAIGGSVTGSTVIIGIPRKRWMNLFRAGTQGALGALVCHLGRCDPREVVVGVRDRGNAHAFRLSHLYIDR
jgi:hypothetical protein